MWRVVNTGKVYSFFSGTLLSVPATFPNQLFILSLKNILFFSNIFFSRTNIVIFLDNISLSIINSLKNILFFSDKHCYFPRQQTTNNKPPATNQSWNSRWWRRCHATPLAQKRRNLALWKWRAKVSRAV